MKNASINRTSAYFLQAVLVLIGIGVLAFMLWAPTVEGRNVNATLFEVYFNDPFLAYVYAASVLFFVALYKAFTLLGDIGQTKGFSPDSVRALRTIRYCATALVVCIAGAATFIVVSQGGKDDIAGGVAMCLFATIISVGIAAAAGVGEKSLGRAVRGSLKAA